MTIFVKLGLNLGLDFFFLVRCGHQAGLNIVFDDCSSLMTYLGLYSNNQL